MSETNERQKKALAMKERLRQFSQAPSDPDGPLPGISDVVGDRIQSTPTILPELEPEPDRIWRSQGITVYSVDDTRLERLAEFFKSRRIRFGRRGQISLLAGAGIAALERLLEGDPATLLEIVKTTMHEREGMSARGRQLTN
jgi:hypothetical protein